MLRLSLCLLALGASFLAAPGRAADDLSVGVAVVDITPPKGQRMAGYYADRFNTGTKDPLQAKAIVFAQGDRRAALVLCDLIGLRRDITQEARKLAEAKTGIPAANIALCATHSHTGPVLEGEYRDTLHEKLAGAIIQAHAALAPARLAAGVGHEEGLSFNRRFHMKAGPVRFNPGVQNPDIIRPAGPIDPDVGVVAVRPAEGDEPRAILSVFALHLDTVGGTEYSADYPHFLERRLREALGPRVVSLFGAGTCGDINHIDVKSKGGLKTEAIGAGLARDVLAELPRLKALDAPALDARSKTLQLPLQSADPASSKGTPQDVEAIATPDKGFLTTVRDAKLKWLASLPGPDYPAEVQAFRLGPDLAIVTLPGEVFVELGQAIKRGSPFKTTLVIELANDTPNYIPTKKAFSEGSYETINSLLAPGSGERLVEAALELLKGLAR